MAEKKSFHILKAKDIALTPPEKRVSNATFSTSIRVLQQNWRQGTVAVKGRSDVARSTKKPWKQKGTGRARAGSARSPLWRGGGVTFGPQKRVKSLSLPQKMRKKVLQGLLFHAIQNDKVGYIDWVPTSQKPKTADAYKAFVDAGLQNKKILFFVNFDDMLVSASIANISNVSMVSFDQANAYDLTSSNNWVFLKKDLDSFKNMLARWT